MARSGITITGGKKFRRKLLAAQAKTPVEMLAANEEALFFLEAKAKEILDFDQVVAKK